MKNPKILYILISIFCVVAIGSGIYAQFFVSDEDKDNIIMPPLNQGDENTVTPKSQEEIKMRFCKLIYKWATRN